MINDDFIRIGIITGVHGLNGRLKILITSDNPERFKIDTEIYLQLDKIFKKFRIEEFIEHKGKVGLIKFEGISNRDNALAYKGIEIFITKSEALKQRNDLEKNSFLYFDIIGCVVYLNDKQFGVVNDIIQAGSGEILEIIDDQRKKYLVPFVESMIDTTNIYNNRINIHPIEGLFDI